MSSLAGIAFRPKLVWSARIGTLERDSKMRITLLLLLTFGLAACNSAGPGTGMSDAGTETMENAEGMADEGGI
jgi:hypothetical protein